MQHVTPSEAPAHPFHAQDALAGPRYTQMKNCNATESLRLITDEIRRVIRLDQGGWPPECLRYSQTRDFAQWPAVIAKVT